MEQWEGDPVYWIELYQDKSRLIHENGIFDDVYLVAGPFWNWDNKGLWNRMAETTFNLFFKKDQCDW